MFKAIFWLVIIIFAGAGVFWYFYAAPGIVEEMQPVQRRNIRKAAHGSGLVEGSSVPVHLKFPFAGVIDEINCKEGGSVKLNSVVATLNTTEVDHQIKLQEIAIREATAKRDALAARAPAEALEKAEHELRLEQAAVLDAQERLKKLKSPPTAAEELEKREAAVRNVERAQRAAAVAEAEYRQLKVHPTPDETAVASARLEAAKLRNDSSKSELNAAELRLALAEFDKVKRGATPEDLDTAANRAAQARTEEQSALAEKQRLDHPPTPAPIPEAEIKSAQAALDAALAQERQKREQLEALRQKAQAAEVAAANAAVEKETETLAILKQRKMGYELRAPFDALVTKRSVEAGALVQPFEEILSVVDFSKKRVRAEFDVTVMPALLKPNLGATLKSRAFGKDQELSAHVLEVQKVGTRKLLLDDPSQPKGGEIVEVLLEIDPPADAAKQDLFTLLRPGLRVETDIVLETLSNVIAVPKSFVATEKAPDGTDAYYVYRAYSRTKAGDKYNAAKVQVWVGMRDEYFVEITKGLNVDDLVVKPKSGSK